MKQIGMALVVHNGRILIAKRKQGMKLAGFWEFPGGKIEPNETAPACIRREFQEELGMAVDIGEFFETFEYSYPESGSFHFDVYWATCKNPVHTRMDAHDEVAWVLPSDLPKYPFCAADISIIEKIKNINLFK